MSVSSVHAQSLSFDAVISGDLAAQAQDTYSFIAQEGQMLSFLVTSNSLDAIVSVQDLNENVLISNDDYNYPVSRNALIEAFSAPYTGSYTLTIAGYGDTSGAYDLQMVPGYSQVYAQETFDDGDGWQTVDTGSEITPESAIDTGTFNLIQEGMGERAIAVGLDVDSDVYYVKADFSDVSAGDGWRVGLVFRYQDVLNYYAVFLNHNGAWRMIRMADGEEIVLRDWGIHPAIRPGITEFTLSLLVNGSGYDVFYNEAYVGSQVDAALTEGRVGLVVNTVDALGSRVSARVDSLMITTPVQVDNAPLFPMTLTATNSTYTARELERRLVIPAGGVMALNISESFAQQVEAGVSRFPVASEVEFSNFVLGATVSWQASGATLNGCGLVVRDTGDSFSYVLAYVDSGGGHGLSVRDGDEFTDNIFHDNPDGGAMPYQLLMVVVDNTVHYYLDGRYVGRVNTTKASGVIGEAVVNFEETNTECRFTNLWVWTWD